MVALAAAGADTGNITSLAKLAQQGVAGRVEANRLLWNWTHPRGHSTRAYRDKREFFQSSIRRARQHLDEPPKNEKDWLAWVPGKALGPYWEPGHLDFFPVWAEAQQWVGRNDPETMSMEQHTSLVEKAVADARAGMLTMDEVEEERKKAVKAAMESQYLDVKAVLNRQKPRYLFASPMEGGKWSMGWWKDETGQGQWRWWKGD